MADDSKCSRCGEPLLPGTPGGHCLRCLLEFSIDTEDGDVVPVLPAPILSEKIGDQIGPYRLLEIIGEGGCGMVYLAEQAQPIRRRVALKIIKLGMDTKSVMARFEAERHILGLMDHPHIAKVIDAGATQTGRPYFVMDLVEGQKITDYCDDQRLDTAERLRLFVQVCAAVQHAHQKGVVHRDIKPSNVLVTEIHGAPISKVIDFGIAKATMDQPLTDKTSFTAFEQFIGTPAYMSPEQAGLNALNVDTRSDIYSLGVLLYELLTGKPPFDTNDLRRAALDEVLRTIREREPARPSTRLTALRGDELTRVAARRQIEPARLPKVLRGDLDWVVMKSLEKDRKQRYQAASDLAGDVERFLACKPVTAHPPSALYGLQKTIRRNRRQLVTCALVVAALLAILLPVWLYDRHDLASRLTQALAPIHADAPAFTNSAAGSWRYSELIEDHPKSTAYFPTATNEYASARFRGYVVFQESAGLAYPAKDGGPEILDPSGNTGYQIFTTWLESDTDQTLNLVCNGDDGHSLFVDGQFLGGGGFHVTVSNTLPLRAHVPRKLTLALYNSVGGWVAYIGLAPWNGFTNANWSNLLITVPGLSLNADGFPSNPQSP